MPSKNPRINVVLEPPLFKNVQFLAEKDGVSLSTKVRDLLKDAMEIQEDICLADAAEKRENTLDAKEMVTHEDTWL
jgi:hypothetical protein